MVFAPVCETMHMEPNNQKPLKAVVTPDGTKPEPQTIADEQTPEETRDQQDNEDTGDYVVVGSGLGIDE